MDYLQPYAPKAFWRVSLSVHRGMHRNLPNALVLLAPAAAAVFLSEFADTIRWDLWDVFSFGAILIPFTTLVGLLTTFRVNDAFNKYKSGRELAEVSSATHTSHTLASHNPCLARVV